MKANNNFIYFFTLYVLSFSETVFFKQLLGVDRLIYESYIQQLTTEQIKDLCSLNNLWSLISYIAMPVILLIKIYIIASILDIGLFLFSQKTFFSQLLNIHIGLCFLHRLHINKKYTDRIHLTNKKRSKWSVEKPRLPYSKCPDALF